MIFDLFPWTAMTLHFLIIVTPDLHGWCCRHGLILKAVADCCWFWSRGQCRQRPICCIQGRSWVMASLHCVVVHGQALVIRLWCLLEAGEQTMRLDVTVHATAHYTQTLKVALRANKLEMCRPIAHQRVQLHITRDRSLSPEISGILIQLKRRACHVSRIFSLLAYLVTRLTASQQAMQCLVEALSDLSQIPCRQRA